MNNAQRCQSKCTACEHPISATTPEALHMAMLEHAEYVNREKDQTTDIHFEDARREALITDAR